MNGDSELVALVDLIYEAVLDSGLWPSVLVKLANATGAAQVSMTSRGPTSRYLHDALAAHRSRFGCVLQGILQQPYPLWARTTSWPAGKIYTLGDLMPRRDFSATSVFNEWWRPSGRGLAAAGARHLRG
jgi:hypothetical protein